MEKDLIQYALYNGLEIWDAGGQIQLVARMFNEEEGFYGLVSSEDGFDACELKDISLLGIYSDEEPDGIYIEGLTVKDAIDLLASMTVEE